MHRPRLPGKCAEGSAPAATGALTRAAMLSAAGMLSAADMLSAPGVIGT